MSRGIFITFEGGDGVGKSTQMSLLADNLTSLGYTVCVLREPGGTRVGQAVRSIVLDPATGNLDPTAELLLYEAARAQLVAEVIKPALERGEVVLCDRFSDSTLAYQGFGRGIDITHIDEVNAIATAGCIPDRTVLIELDPARGLARARAREAGADRMEREGAAFHGAVHDGFLALASREPERFRIVSQAPSHIDTAAAILQAIEDLLPPVSGSVRR